MAGKRISELTEVLTVDVENDYVVIARDGDNKKLKVANMMGSTNVGDDYVDLKSDDGKEYRLIINNDGKVQIFPKDSVVGNEYKPGDNFLAPLRTTGIVVGAMGAATAVGENNTKVVDGHGIVINQAYGGGDILPTTTSQGCAVSHSFVELYNCSNVNSVPLCGLYLHYKGNEDTAWKTLALRGEIPPRHSFLIRGKQHGNLFGDMINCKVYDYDQEWVDEQTKEPIAFSKLGMSLYLSINPQAPEGNENPKAYIDQKDPTTGVVTGTTYDKYYVDLLAAGSADGVNNPSAFNLFFHNCMDKDTAIRRINFRNNKNNKYDAGPINYRTHDNVEAVRPRSLRDGVWEQPADKIQPKDNVPNLVNITLGKEPTTRFFTWQSSVTDRGAVRMRRIKDAAGAAAVEAWIEIESDRELVNNHGLFMTIHRVKVENLEAGLYEYKVGEPGFWSDEELINVRAIDNNSKIRMLWTTDQQGYTELEYKAWDTCVKAMKDASNFYDANGIPNFDFHLNTGDISQNASNLYEWLYYNVYADEFCRNIPHMISCGNNDLVDKKYGFAFEHYSTYEDVPMLNDHHKETLASKDQPMVSTYSFDLGHTHFVCLNSNSEEMYGDYGVDKTEFLLKQAYFLDKDLYEVSQRAEKPHWVVVYAHLSPFTVTRAKRLQHWIAICEHYGVDLFLCGHNHTYSRSIPIKCGYEKAYKDAIKESNYNTYVTTGTSYTVVEETKLDGSEIDRTAHPEDGTYYVMFQAAGAKLSGKEKALDLSTAVYQGIDAKHLSTVATGTRPWWYGFDRATLPVQPCYSVMEATADVLDLHMYYVDKIVTNDKETGIQTVADYDPATNVPVEFDTLTINYADRQPAYRTGVDTPYYEENK